MISTRIAQKFSGQVVEGQSQAMRSVVSVLESSQQSNTVLQPIIWSNAIRRQHMPLRSVWTSQARFADQLSLSIDRITRNMKRLRNRRLLEIALVAMAAKEFTSQMEQAIEQPADWADWSRKDWTDELMETLGTSKFQRFVSAANRVAQLTMLATPLAVMAPFAYFSDTVHKYSWRYALWGIEQAGPTAIKWVQWATTRQDLFSPEFCQYFGKLRDETTGHAWKDTKIILEEDLGPLAKALELENTPIGSGCIAQVYRGTLKENIGQFTAGQELAIKVQHPDIWQKVCTDFYLLGKVAKLLESIPVLQLRYLALVDTVRQFRDIMLPQLDLTLEAKHLQRFNRDFASNDRVNFPHPLAHLTTKRVLTETFLPGTPILEYNTAPESIRKQLAHLGVELTLRMIFLNDFLHGDLHPGNILVHQSESGEVSMNLLDCGLVVEMGPTQHVNLTKIMGAFSRRDGRLAGQLMVDSSSDCQADEEGVKYFVEGIARICNEDTSFIEHVGDKITDICYLACRHQVKLEPAFISAALAIEIIEGVAKHLYHDIPVASPALRFIVQAEVMHKLEKMTLW